MSTAVLVLHIFLFFYFLGGVSLYTVKVYLFRAKELVNDTPGAARPNWGGGALALKISFSFRLPCGWYCRKKDGQLTPDWAAIASRV